MTVMIERARDLHELLTRIRMEAAIEATREGGPEAGVDAEHLLDDLFCLIRDADLVPDVETHLQTVCELAVRYVEACVLPPVRIKGPQKKGAWSCSLTNYGPLERAIREVLSSRSMPTETYLHRRHMVGYRLDGIVWDVEPSTVRSSLPSTVFLSEREVRLFQRGHGLELRDAVDAAFKARHPVPALSYRIGLPIPADYDEDMPDAG